MDDHDFNAWQANVIRREQIESNEARARDELALKEKINAQRHEYEQQKLQQAREESYARAEFERDKIDIQREIFEEKLVREDRREAKRLKIEAEQFETQRADEEDFFKRRLEHEYNRDKNRQKFDLDRDKQRRQDSQELAYIQEQFRIDAEYRKAKVEYALEEIRHNNALELQRAGSLAEYQKFLTIGTDAVLQKSLETNTKQSQAAFDFFLTNATAIIAHKLEIKRQTKVAELEAQREAKRMEHALELERVRIDGEIRKAEIADTQARYIQWRQEQHAIVFATLTSELKDKNLSHEEYTRLAVRLLERMINTGAEKVAEEQVKEWLREFSE